MRPLGSISISQQALRKIVSGLQARFCFGPRLLRRGRLLRASASASVWWASLGSGVWVWRARDQDGRGAGLRGSPPDRCVAWRGRAASRSFPPPRRVRCGAARRAAVTSRGARKLPSGRGVEPPPSASGRTRTEQGSRGPASLVVRQFIPRSLMAVRSTRTPMESWKPMQELKIERPMQATGS